MSRYRMSVPASICLTVEAASEEEAAKKVRDVLRAVNDEVGTGFDGPRIKTDGVDHDIRVYSDEEADPAVEDVEDD